MLEAGRAAEARVPDLAPEQTDPSGPGPREWPPGPHVGRFVHSRDGADPGSALCAQFSRSLGEFVLIGSVPN